MSFLSFFRINLKQTLVYKVNLISQLLISSFSTIAFYLFVSRGMDLGFIKTGEFSLKTYYLILIIFGIINSSNMASNISGQIQSGNISGVIKLPISFLKYNFYSFLSEWSFRVIFFAVPIIIAILVILNESLHITISFYFFIFLFFSILINFQIQLFIGLTSFKSIRNYNLEWTMKNIIRLISGQIIPLYLFPDVIVQILSFLPFKFIFYTPIIALTGNHTFNDIYLGLFWTIVLSISNYYLFNKSRTQLAVFGG